MNDIIKILSLFFKGQFAMALYLFAREVPVWFFRFNKAYIVKSENIVYPKNINNDVKSRIATIEDLNDIVRINQISSEIVMYMQNEGSKCIIGGLDNQPPASVAWMAYGKIYVRGMGFYYDFGQDSSYIYGAATTPEARGKGMHNALMTTMFDYEEKNGVKNYYAMLEQTNKLSYDIRIRLGYYQFMTVYHLKLFPIYFSYYRNDITRKWTFKVFTTPPSKDCVII